MGIISNNIVVHKNSNTHVDDKKTWLLLIALSLLLLDKFWGFIYTKTIYANVLAEYVSVLFFFLLYLRIAFRYNWGKWSSLSIVWAPYIIITFLGYALTPAIMAPYWLICLIVLLVAKKTSFYNAFPSKVILYSGVIALIGIAVQIFLPSFYSANILMLFINEERMENWGDEYGYNGFTYQLDTTAKLLIYAEVIVLYLREEVLYKQFRNIVSYILILLLIIGVFLTGKRSMAAIALILPFFVYFLSESISGKKILTFFFVAIVSYLAFSYFVEHLSEFSDSIVLRRFAHSYRESMAGHDITSNRTYLYGLAWNVFLDNPWFGIGVDQFIKVTHAYTDVHNTFLQVLCEQGVFGFVLYVFPIIYSFIYTLKVCKKVKNNQLRKYTKLSLAIQIFYIIYAMTGNENIGVGYIMYFIGIAIVISVEGKMEKEYFQNVIKR